MGIEKTAFGGLALAASFCMVAGSYWGIPVLIGLFLIARWLTKKDDQFIAVLIKYLDEDHVYDTVPRISDYNNRPKGWGKGLPL